MFIYEEIFGNEEEQISQSEISICDALVFNNIIITTYTFARTTEELITKLFEINPKINVSLIISATEKTSVEEFKKNNSFKFKVKYIDASYTHHEKIILFYNNSLLKVYIGSFNFTYGGLRDNLEIGKVYVSDKFDIKEVEEYVNKNIFGEYNKEHWINFSDSSIINSICDFLNFIITNIKEGNTLKGLNKNLSEFYFNEDLEEYFLSTVNQNILHKCVEKIKSKGYRISQCKVITPFLNAGGIQRLSELIDNKNIVLLTNYLPDFSYLYSTDSTINYQDFKKLKHFTKYYVFRKMKTEEYINFFEDIEDYAKIKIRNKFIHAKVYIFECEDKLGNAKFVSFVGSANLTNAVWGKGFAKNIETGILNFGDYETKAINDLFTELVKKKNYTILLDKESDWKEVNKEYINLERKELLKDLNILQHPIIDEKSFGIIKKVRNFEELKNLDIKIKFNKNLLKFEEIAIELRLINYQQLKPLYKSIPLKVIDDFIIFNGSNIIGQIPNNYYVQEINIKIKSKQNYPFKLIKLNNKIITNDDFVKCFQVNNNKLIDLILYQPISLQQFKKGDILITKENPYSLVYYFKLLGNIYYADDFITNHSIERINLQDEEYYALNLHLNIAISIQDLTFKKDENIVDYHGFKKVNEMNWTILFKEMPNKIKLGLRYSGIIKNKIFEIESEELKLEDNNFQLPIMDISKINISDIEIKFNNNKHLKKILLNLITVKSKLYFNESMSDKLQVSIQNAYNYDINVDEQDIMSALSSNDSYSIIQVRGLNKVAENFYLVSSKWKKYEVLPSLFSSKYLSYRKNFIRLDNVKELNAKYQLKVTNFNLSKLKDLKIKNILIYLDIIDDAKYSKATIKNLDFPYVKRNFLLIPINSEFSKIYIFCILDGKTGIIPLVIPKNELPNINFATLGFKKWFFEKLLEYEGSSYPGKIDTINLYDIHTGTRTIESQFNKPILFNIINNY